MTKNSEARWIAAKAGETKFTGLPCKHCSSPLRFTSSGGCVACSNKKSAERYKKVRDLLKGAQVFKQE